MSVYYCKPRRKNRYPDAFNGFADVSGLRRGDTLVLKGLHDSGYMDNNLVIDVPGVKVIGDLDDPFRLIACAVRYTDPSKWTGPNEFGVYTTKYPGHTSRIVMQGSRVLRRMYVLPDDSWEDGCFCQPEKSKILYIRPFDGHMDDVFYTDSSYGIKVRAPDVILENLEATLSVRPFEFVGADNCVAEGLKTSYADHGFQIVNTQNARFFNLEASHCAVGGYMNSGGGNKLISSGCVFSWVKIRQNDQENYFRYADNHGWGVQGGNYNLFEAFDIDGSAGTGFTNYQFRGQQMCHNTYRDMDIRNIRNLDPNHPRNERGFEFGSDMGVEPELHVGNKAYDVRIDNARLGVRLKSLYSKDGPVWDCQDFDIHNCDVGLQITGKKYAGLKFTDSKFTNCRKSIDNSLSYMPHVELARNTIVKNR